MLNPTKTTRPKQTDQNTASASLVLAGIKRPGTQLVAGWATPRRVRVSSMNSFWKEFERSSLSLPEIVGKSSDNPYRRKWGRRSQARPFATKNHARNIKTPPAKMDLNGADQTWHGIGTPILIIQLGMLAWKVNLQLWSLGNPLAPLKVIGRTLFFELQNQCWVLLTRLHAPNVGIASIVRSDGMDEHEACESAVGNP